MTSTLRSLGHAVVMALVLTLTTVFTASLNTKMQWTLETPIATNSTRGAGETKQIPLQSRGHAVAMVAYVDLRQIPFLTNSPNRLAT